jgi:propanediol utilization protein
MSQAIPVHVQYRHVHLSVDDARVLFGSGEITKMIELPHRGQHVGELTVDLLGTNGVRMERVRVFGPTRDATQVELSPTESFALGIDAPVRLSGDLNRTPGCTIVGPSGTVRIGSGVIVPARHIHCSEREAVRLGLKHQMLVTVAPLGRPDVRIELVSVRIHPTFALSFHLTYDEASEFWLETGNEVSIV